MRRLTTFLYMILLLMATADLGEDSRDLGSEIGLRRR